MRAWDIVEYHVKDGADLPPDGKWLVHDGELVLRKSGYYASKRLLDALRPYHGADAICRVEVDGKIIEGPGMLVAERRKILWRVDGEDVLNAFARWCALQVAHMWDAPELVIDYLETGAEKYREATKWLTLKSAWDIPLDNPFVDDPDLLESASENLIWLLAATVTWWATGYGYSAGEGTRLAARDSATCLRWLSGKDGIKRDIEIVQNEQLERMAHEAHSGQTEWIFEHKEQ